MVPKQHTVLTYTPQSVDIEGQVLSGQDGEKILGLTYYVTSSDKGQSLVLIHTTFAQY